MIKVLCYKVAKLSRNPWALSSFSSWMKRQDHEWVLLPVKAVHVG